MNDPDMESCIESLEISYLTGINNWIQLSRKGIFREEKSDLRPGYESEIMTIGLGGENALF